MSAQSIRGMVVNAKNEPLIGVSVVPKGNEKSGTVTDINGRFVVNIKNVSYPMELHFYYIGYEDHVLTLRKAVSDVGKITLKENTYSLSDVVVIGYGEQSRKKLTGAVAKVKGEVVSSATQDAPLLALQGNAAGVYIQQASGVPGGGSSGVVIRGYNSLSTNNSYTKPLYIIDGVPFNTNKENPVGYVATGVFGLSDALDFLNPSDIESIEVLKDADATAIYGTRGANGVVLITTKKGTTGKVKVNFQLSSTAQWVAKRLDFIGTEEYLDLRKKAFEADKSKGYLTDADYNADNFPDLFIWDQHKDYNWQDALLGHTAWGTDGQLSISGGSQNTSFFLSGSYYNSETVTIANDDYRRLTGHANIMHHTSDNRLKLETGLTVSNLLQKAGISGSPYSYLNTAPNTPLWDEQGRPYYVPDNKDFNAPLSITAYSGENRVTSLIANFVGSYKIWKELTAKVNAGYEYSSSVQNNLYKRYYYNPYDVSRYNFARYYTLTTSTINIEPQLSYRADLLGGSTTFLVGGTYQSGENRTLYVQGQDYPGDMFLKDASSAARINTHTNPVQQSKIVSLFGRISYDYQSRYLLNVVFRRDGSSRFGPNHRFGNFYSAGGAWLFSNEKLIANSRIGKWLSYGKVRVSYGKTGNDNIDNYAYMTKYKTSAYPYEGSVGVIPNNLANNDLHWESTKKFDIGLELGFIHDRILLSASFYNNQSKDLLWPQKLPGQAGFSTITANMNAKIQNRGLELELNTQNVNNRNFKWTTSFNITFSKNKLLEYENLESSSYYNTYRVGKSVNLIRLYRYLGVDNQTGLPKVEDVNTDDKITSADDYQNIGDRDPKFYGGVTNSFSYKGVTLDFQFYFRKKPYQYGYLWRFYNPIGMQYNVKREMAENYWTTPGIDAKYPGLTTTKSSDIYNAYFYYLSYSDAAYSSGSYVKLKNVRLSYALPYNWLKPLGIGALQLYVQGKNLFTITHYDSYDPETGDVSIPPLTSVTFGLNMTF